MWCNIGFLLVFTLNIISTLAKIESREDTAESGYHEEFSEEYIGATVTRVVRHPYAASLLKNDTYLCSAIILNTYWVLTISKCFSENVISSYVTYKNLSDFSIRTGSSYNNKGGNIKQIKKLVNNFDLKVSAVKLAEPLEFNSQVDAVSYASKNEDVSLGYLSTMIAWTPTGHIRVVNAPVIDPGVCESTAKLLPGYYICVGGVQDPNRHFCRKDNGGAVIQNNTLIAISTFVHTCALYSRTHSFPKASSFARWLDTTIWDENNRPTTTTTSTTQRTSTTTNSTEANEQKFFVDPQKFMLTLPFDPINVPLEPAEDNSVIPHMSMYESYLRNLARIKTSTTPDPSIIEEERKEWLEKNANRIMMMSPKMYPKKLDIYDYNN